LSPLAATSFQRPTGLTAFNGSMFDSLFADKETKSKPEADDEGGSENESYFCNFGCVGDQ
jgi:hypothetical protein